MTTCGDEDIGLGENISKEDQFNLQHELNFNDLIKSSTQYRDAMINYIHSDGNKYRYDMVTNIWTKYDGTLF